MVTHLTESQETVLDSIKEFLFADDETVFVLKGYAGTGKTTMIRFLTSWLKQHSWDYWLLAPTGRAAKVISAKTGDEASTIHSALFVATPSYSPREVPKKERSSGVFLSLKSKLATPAPDIMIIDESSMIGNGSSPSRDHVNGGDRLLDALMSFRSHHDIPKIVFIGDDAQLPPVGSENSPALDPDYLRKRYDIGVRSAMLTEVLRQGGKSGILMEATEMRESLAVPLPGDREHTIAPNGRDIRKVRPSDIAETFVHCYPKPELGDCIIVSYTNRATDIRNSEVRKLIFGKDARPLEVGDILMVTRNQTLFNEMWYNGDFISVTELVDSMERTCTVRYKEEEHSVTLRWQLCEVMHDGKSGLAFILLNALLPMTADEREIMRRAVFVAYCQRMEEQEIEYLSNEWLLNISTDVFYNALQVKYGYAVTCHKSQGGEWDTVFVDYGHKNGTSDDDIRWDYTATTRASRMLFITNRPVNEPISDDAEDHDEEDWLC